jgi:hypothetical protein
MEVGPNPRHSHRDLNTSSGYYSADLGYFNNDLANGPLTAPASSSSGGNGVFSSEPLPERFQSPEISLKFPG